MSNPIWTPSNQMVRELAAFVYASVHWEMPISEADTDTQDSYRAMAREGLQCNKPLREIVDALEKIASCEPHDPADVVSIARTALAKASSGKEPSDG